MTASGTRVSAVEPNSRSAVCECVSSPSSSGSASPCRRALLGRRPKPSQAATEGVEPACRPSPVRKEHRERHHSGHRVRAGATRGKRTLGPYRVNPMGSERCA